MILQILKVSEDSLVPDYRDGDFVFISKIPIFLRGVCAGDVVVFEHPTTGRLIKRVARVLDGGKALWVLGLSADSVDSRSFGPVSIGQVVGKVVWHVSAR